MECQVVSDNEIQVDSERDETLSDDAGTSWDNPVLIEDTGKETESDIWIKVGNHLLKGDEKSILLSSDMWLNDIIINAAQSPTKVKYPQIGGFQDTLLQWRLSFSVENGEFIQILNHGNNHWITVTNIGMSTMSAVCVFDSLNGKRFSHEMQKIIASILHPNKTEVLMKVEDVQFQEDGHSCGLFAIAFAVSLCHGDDPRKLVYSQPEMRQHLLTCLQNGEILPFPILTDERKPNLGHLLSFAIHCSCHMPLDPDELWTALQCTLCHGRYHKDCEAGREMVVFNVNFDQERSRDMSIFGSR